MEGINLFCDKCKNKENLIWFKTKDHYLDLKKGEYNYYQFEDFSKELKKHNLYVKELGDKTLEIVNSKKNIKINIHRHECGPEILFDFAKGFVVNGAVALIIEVLKKLVEKKAKKRKEKPVFVVYVFQGCNRVQINSFDKDSIIEAIKEAKRSRDRRN